MIHDLYQNNLEFNFVIQAKADLNDGKVAFRDRLEEKYDISKTVTEALLKLGELVKIENDIFIKK